MSKQALLIVLLCLLPQWLSAQKYEITGTVRDLFTENAVDQARVALLHADSTVIGDTIAETKTVTEAISENVYLSKKSEKEGALFTLSVPGEGSYILRARKEGYEDCYQDIKVAFKSRQHSLDIGDVYMQQQSKQLGEAIVTGTKIKMFYKGDTLVYNAQAFMLPEGSMLDDLVKQLPGAEIRDGNIYVGGKMVDNLLLGGKDFFNGNPQAALKNLPAYVVGRVKVYDKAGERSETTGTDMGDKQYVMDVHLKRQYIGTVMGELHAGYGTEERYTAGGYLMRFDDRQSFTLMGDFNNQNTDNTYGQYGFNRQKPYGDHERHYLAGDYRFEPNGKIKLTANVSAEHRDVDLRSGSASETYLTDGNLYGRSLSTSNQRSWKVDGKTKLTLRPKQGRFYEVGYTGQYQNARDRSLSRSASYDALPDETDIDSLLHHTFLRSSSAEELRAITLNRLQQQAKSRSNNSTHLAQAKTQFALGPDLLELSGEYKRYQAEMRNFDTYHLEYPKTNGPSDYRHRFGHLNQSTNHYKAEAGYAWQLYKGECYTSILTPGYGFTHDDDDTDSPLYRLDRLDLPDNPWGEGGHAAIGTLPSAAEALLSTVRDESESYRSASRLNRHSLQLEWLQQFHYGEKSELELKATAAVSRTNQELDYERFGRTYRQTRRDWLPLPSFKLEWKPAWQKGNKRKTTLTGVYNLYSQQPALYDLLDIRDDSNPLSVRLGNPELDNTTAHHAALSLIHRWSDVFRYFNLHGLFRMTNNLTAFERTFDRQSGVTTLRPVNVDGNWKASVIAYLGYSFDKEMDWFMMPSFEYTVSQNRDLAFISGADRSTESNVRTTTVNPMFSCRLTPLEGFCLAPDVEVVWRHVTGDRPDFEEIKATDLSLGLEATIELPWELQFETEFSATKRFGYNDRSLNDFNCLWNMSLNRTFGKWNVKVSAYDLLADDLFTKTALDAQGRTETFSTTLPRYFMLSLSRKFNKVGKKK